MICFHSACSWVQSWRDDNLQILQIIVWKARVIWSLYVYWLNMGESNFFLHSDCLQFHFPDFVEIFPLMYLASFLFWVGQKAAETIETTTATYTFYNSNNNKNNNNNNHAQDAGSPFPKKNNSFNLWTERYLLRIRGRKGRETRTRETDLAATNVCDFGFGF